MCPSLNLKQSAGHAYLHGWASHVAQISSFIWICFSLSMSYLLTASLSSMLAGFISLFLSGKDHGSFAKGISFPSVIPGTVSKISSSVCHHC